ncbi:hypothetical protein NPIL_284811, partial [Nephila pilipes]
MFTRERVMTSEAVGYRENAFFRGSEEAPRTNEGDGVAATVGESKRVSDNQWRR